MRRQVSSPPAAAAVADEADPDVEGGGGGSLGADAVRLLSVREAGQQGPSMMDATLAAGSRRITCRSLAAIVLLVLLLVVLGLASSLLQRPCDCAALHGASAWMCRRNAGITAAAAGSDAGKPPAAAATVAAAPAAAAAVAAAPPPDPDDPDGSWSALAAAMEAGWCMYPAYPSSFVFDHERYEREYLAPNQTCGTWHTQQTQQAAAQSASAGSAVAAASPRPIPFDVALDAHGVMAVTGCVGGRVSYSLEHDAGPLGSGSNLDGGWPPSLAALQSLDGSAPLSVRLPFPSSFVFVWCDNPTARPGSSRPAFRPVHTPVPPSILRTRPVPVRRRGPRANVTRRSILIFELDALSAKQLPVLMPRTHALLESMRDTNTASADAPHNKQRKSSGADDAAASRSPSSFVSRAPSHTVSYRFTQTALSGTNSIPSFLALFGSGCYASIPAGDSPHWLWNTARTEGFTTGFGESGCSFHKYAEVGLGAHTLPTPSPGGTTETRPSLLSGKETKAGSGAPPSVGVMDYNALLSVCSLPMFPSSGWIAEFGPRCVEKRPAWEVALDPLRFAIERQSEAITAAAAAATTSAGSSSVDSLSSHPLFFSQVMMEAHESSGFLARHMDGSGFDEWLARMLASPAMQNAIVIVYSDHGLHYGTFSFASAHGSQEHLDPFLYVLVPRTGPGSLSDSESRMLQLNAPRLTSPFDWHRTMMALIRDRDEPAETEDEATQQMSSGAYNLLSEAVPASRACEQLPSEPLDNFWNPSRRMAPLCLCESPFSRVCRTRPRDLAPMLWNECTQLRAHPLVFDAAFYARLHRKQIQALQLELQQLQPQDSSTTTAAADRADRAGSNVHPSLGPCAALHHWCTRGIYSGLQSSESFHLRALIALQPHLADNLADPLSFLRRFVREAHRSNPPPITRFPSQGGGAAFAALHPPGSHDLLPPASRAEFAAFASVSVTATQVERLHALSDACGDATEPGDQLWMRTITTQARCGETTEQAAGGSASASAGSSSAPAPLSPLESRSLVSSSRWQCFHWCVFDLPSSSSSPSSDRDAITGWEVTGAECLQRFDGSIRRADAQQSVCITQFAALKAEAMDRKNSADVAANARAQAP